MWRLVNKERQRTKISRKKLWSFPTLFWNYHQARLYNINTFSIIKVFMSSIFSLLFYARYGQFFTDFSFFQVKFWVLYLFKLFLRLTLPFSLIILQILKQAFKFEDVRTCHSKLFLFQNRFLHSHLKVCPKNEQVLSTVLFTFKCIFLEVSRCLYPVLKLWICSMVSVSKKSF